MDYTDVTGWVTASKGALDLLKSAFSLLPKGAERDRIGVSIKQAEEAIRASDAKLAKDLGYRLCRCTFPPTPMLWNKDQRASFCQLCGDKYPPDQEPTDPDEGFTWAQARQGRR
jgi:hypothetical protein